MPQSELPRPGHICAGLIYAGGEMADRIRATACRRQWRGRHSSRCSPRKEPWELVSSVYPARQRAQQEAVNHEAAIALHYLHYNFCRIHQTLRVTPAMEAGLSDHVWTIEEFVALLGWL
jgi:hypothetical protein